YSFSTWSIKTLRSTISLLAVSVPSRTRRVSSENISTAARSEITIILCVVGCAQLLTQAEPVSVIYRFATALVSTKNRLNTFPDLRQSTLPMAWRREQDDLPVPVLHRIKAVFLRAHEYQLRESQPPTAWRGPLRAPGSSAYRHA